MKARTKISLTPLLAVVVLAAALTACSGSDPQPDAAQQPAKTKSANNQSKSPRDTRVKAVVTGSGTAPVDLQFELAARPEPGMPVEVNLYMLGINDATALELTVKPEAKLEVTTGSQASFASIKVGELLTHSFSLRSAATGIQVADVQLVAMVDGQPKTFNFAIPVAVSPMSSASSSATK